VFAAAGPLLGDALLDGRQGVRREALKALWSHWKHAAGHLLILSLLLAGRERGPINMGLIGREDRSIWG